MDAMRLLGFIGIVVAAGVVMAFVFEFLNTERGSDGERRRVLKAPVVESVAVLPSFFAKPGFSDRAPANAAFDEAMIALLEEHVRAERAMVTRFVHFPSLDSLYRQANHPTLH